VTDRVLITSSDPGGLARAVEKEIGEPLPWCRLDAPGFDQSVVWFCAGTPPESPLTLPKLRWIQSGWAGIENWFQRPEWGNGVTLTRTIGDFPERIAQHVLGYLLARGLRVDASFREMAEKTWKRWTPDSLQGKNLLVVGMGLIGAEVASAARAFGMEVTGVTRSTTGDQPELLGRADAVVNLLPLTLQTESFWNAERFQAMKPGATFLNVSRGATVDDAALLRALGKRRPAFAILDVFREEPLPPESPFRGRDDVWITPHVAGIGTPEALARDFAENWKRFRVQAPLHNMVDRARGY
jgi:phosphoglycerate dehydrogenase-like enzyme